MVFSRGVLVKKNAVFLHNKTFLPTRTPLNMIFYGEAWFLVEKNAVFLHNKPLLPTRNPLYKGFVVGNQGFLWRKTVFLSTTNPRA